MTEEHDNEEKGPRGQQTLSATGDSARPEDSEARENQVADATEGKSEEETGEGAGEQEAERPQSPEEKLVASLSEFKNELQKRVRPLLRSKKALEQICRTGAIENLELVQKYTGWLQKADLEPLELEEERTRAVGGLTKYVERRKRKRRMDFMRGLDRAGRRQDLRVEKLSESPLTVSVHPFTVQADFQANEATLSFARCTVDTVALDPGAVLEAREARREEILEAAVDSERFFERLHRAYRAVLDARREAEGERVDLVDLLAPLALYSSDVEAWRGSDLAAIGPYPRYQLAFQLTQLRRDGLLEHQGRRLDLGTATGGSTEDKDDVLYIPSGPRDGQYYLSIRFTSDNN